MANKIPRKEIPDELDDDLFRGSTLHVTGNVSSPSRKKWKAGENLGVQETKEVT